MTCKNWIPGSLFVALLCACGSKVEPEDSTRLADDWAGERSASSDFAAQIPADAPLVIFLGDSMSAGLHLDADQAFPAAAQRQLAEQGLPFRLVNAGVSGDTTSGGLARLDWLLKQEPAIVVVELGANDGLRGLELQAIEANLRAILTRVQASGAQPLLLGMHIPTSYGPAYTSGFSAMYGRLAQELDVPFVSDFLLGVGGEPHLNLADGIHPNPRGHELLAQNLAQALADLLQGL